MNTSSQRIRLAVLAAALLVCAGCNSTKLSLPTGPVPHYDEKKPRKITAEASGFQLLLFIPIGVNERYQDAWFRLSSQASGDYITDVTVTDSWTYAFVGTIYHVRLEANAYPILTP